MKSVFGFVLIFAAAVGGAIADFATGQETAGWWAVIAAVLALWAGWNWYLVRVASVLLNAALNEKGTSR